MAFDTFPCNPYPISKGMLEKGNNDELNTRVTALEGEVSDLNDTKANQITIAPFFSAEASYDVGDLVYYNGLTYRCTNDHEGEWDADDFATTTIAGELDTLKSGLMVKTKALTSVSIAAGGYQSFEDADLKNVAIVGYWIGGVAGFNITVTSIISDGSGLHLVIKNNGETAVTPSSISVKYL